MDFPWAVLFLLTVVALILLVATSAGELFKGEELSRQLSSSHGRAPSYSGQAMPLCHSWVTFCTIARVLKTQ